MGDQVRIFSGIKQLLKITHLSTCTYPWCYHISCFFQHIMSTTVGLHHRRLRQIRLINIWDIIKTKLGVPAHDLIVINWQSWIKVVEEALVKRKNTIGVEELSNDRAIKPITEATYPHFFSRCYHRHKLLHALTKLKWNIFYPIHVKYGWVFVTGVKVWIQVDH